MLEVLKWQILTQKLNINIYFWFLWNKETDFISSAFNQMMKFCLFKRKINLTTSICELQIKPII